MLLAVDFIKGRFNFQTLNEEEAIRKAFLWEIIEFKSYGKLYVIRARGCDPKKIKMFKSVLRGMGYKELSKRVVVCCEE